MNLRKEIQVALNSCEPNKNRVDKIEAIAKKYAEFYHDCQLKQNGVNQTVCNYCLELVDELPDKFCCKDCIEKHK